MRKPMRCAIIASWLGAAAVIAVAPGGFATASAQDLLTSGQTTGRVEISIDNFTFEPAEITITPGTTVTWVNHDDIPHTIVEANRSFKSKTLDTDDRFSMTFTSTGSIAYFCSLHPHMTGKVIVKAGS